MLTAWGNATKMLATVAALAVGALCVGCGPAPGYEPEPRMPVGYTALTDEPATSAELAARPSPPDPAAAPPAPQNNGEIVVGAGDTEEYGDTDPSALTEFKPALEGHGQWVDDSTYGTVWVPSPQEVGNDFQPYVSAGHWTYDDSTSWVWVSDYSWGWAPFHYGRWAHVSRHGWAWIPGRTYAGAWVVWRTGGPDYDYVGWAPAGPDWYWYNGVAIGWTWGWSPSYAYCQRGYLYDRGLYGHVYRGPAGREMEAHTRPYAPAGPTVAGGGRVAATPTVGGAGGVGAGGRVAAAPRVGPRPSELGIRSESVVRPPGDNAGLARATALASPHTAVAQGAAPPVGTRRRTLDHDALVTTPPRGGFDGRSSSPAVSSRMEAAARAPQVGGVGAVPPHQAAMTETRPVPRGSSSGFGTTPGMSTPAPVYRSNVPSRVPSQSFSTASPSYRSSSPPTYRSSPTMTTSAPSYRSAPSVSSPSFHSTPSTPTHSAPRSSTPSRSAAPSRGRR